MSKQISIQEQAYLEGFIDKCAEYGVDPEALMKTAARGDQLAKLLNTAGTKLTKPMQLASRLDKTTITPGSLDLMEVIKDPEIKHLLRYFLPRGGVTQSMIAPGIRDAQRAVKSFNPSQVQVMNALRDGKATSSNVSSLNVARGLFDDTKGIDRLVARMRLMGNDPRNSQLGLAALSDTPVGRLLPLLGTK